MTYRIPNGMIVVGTCGKCGGPVLSPQVYGSNSTDTEPPAWCLLCNARALPEQPNYGPIRRME